MLMNPNPVVGSVTACAPVLRRIRAGAIVLSLAIALGAMAGMPEGQPAQGVPIIAAAAPAGPDSGGEPEPTLYATRLPPASTLAYEIRRGLLRGSGELVWQPEGTNYQARLNGWVFGLHVIDWSSSGHIGGAGLAPLRFADQRLGRDVQVAEFRRDTGRITFSRHSVEHPLWPGVQDRLSWMIQLAAIAAADPTRVASGERVTMMVVGARGDAGAWTFVSRGVETVDLGQGRVRAVALLRESRKPRDVRAEAWLDPERNYLPVRARLSQADGSDSLDLIMQR